MIKNLNQINTICTFDSQKSPFGKFDKLESQIRKRMLQSNFP